MPIFVIPVFLGNMILFNIIKKDDPEFIKGAPGLKNNYFSMGQNFPWIILFGKYKSLKNLKLKFWCSVVRILFVVDICFFVIFNIALLMTVVLK